MIQGDFKTCKGCGESLHLSCFSKHAKNKDGLQGHCKVCNKFSSKKWNANNKDLLALKRIKDRARDNGLLFDLEVQDVTPPPICPGFGFALERSTNGKPTKFSPSVDRIDPTKGYTKDNVQVISNLANAMKQNATKEELIVFAKWILKTYGENE